MVGVPNDSGAMFWNHKCSNVWISISFILSTNEHLFTNLKVVYIAYTKLSVLIFCLFFLYLFNRNFLIYFNDIFMEEGGEPFLCDRSATFLAVFRLSLCYVSAAFVLLHRFPLLHPLPVSLKLVYVSWWQIFLLCHFSCIWMPRAALFKQSHALFYLILTIADDNALYLLVFKAPSYLLFCFNPIMLSRRKCKWGVFSCLFSRW